jgi:two-component system response regulator AtoC
MEGLVNYPWPGNVRELENLLTRAIVLSTGNILLPESFPELFGNLQGNLKESEVIKPLEQIEMEHVAKALVFTHWDKGKACELLGISRPTLRKKIEKYNLRQ